MKIYFALFFLLLAPNISLANEVIRQIQESHISSNLPDTFEEFQKILERDLKIYFQQRYKKPINIGYELLRKGPTKSGIAYPKFYVWVDVNDNNKKIESGAARLASIDKVRIEVTNFITQKEINDNPLLLEAIFPEPLCDGIIKKAGMQ